MLKLVQFHPAFGVRNLSPFCLKLETWLRMAGIEHEVVWSSDTRAAPKGKLPYIIDGSLAMGDSELIIDYLNDKYGDRLDAHLGPEEKAQALAWKKLFEDSLICPLLYSRWIDPAGWQRMQRLFDRLPWPMRLFVPGLVRGGVRKQIYGQGTGRHTMEEIYRLGGKYLDAVAVQLGDKPFMLGETPTSLDATAYGFLANLVGGEFDSPLNRQVRSTPALVAYCERVRQRYFADLG
jgi:glutathione S-transferase